jgi:hypothetical protein
MNHGNGRTHITMHITEIVEVMEVAKTFIAGLGGSGLHDTFVPGPEAVEVTYKDDHAQVQLNYHLSLLSDADRAVVIESLSKVDKVLWGTATNPYGVAWLTTDTLRVKITIEVYTPSLGSRSPLLQRALEDAGWSAVRGVG